MDSKDNDENNINFGGFPPIIFITKMLSKKRDFVKNSDINVNLLNMTNLNIDIKNLLNK
jgi:hypothetical protein